MGFLLVLYTVDTLYVMFYMTEKIDTPTFEVLESGIQITMSVSKSFKTNIKGGLVYICVPFINLEWHAFSVFEIPDENNKKQVFIQIAGDWTTVLHQALRRDTHRPLWIRGPFFTSFNHAMDYDNQIHVAIGSGITPIISVSRAYVVARNVSIIWVVRDQCILEFYLELLSRSNNSWLMVFYTGKTPLSPIFEERWSGTNITIIKRRPHFERVIPNIIFGMERGLRRLSLQPRHRLDEKRQTAIHEIIDTYNTTMETEDVEKKQLIGELYTVARKHGFQLTSLMKVTQDTENENDEENDFFARLSSFVNRMENEISIPTCSPSHLLLSSTGRQYEPWRKNQSAYNFVKGLNKNVLSTWGILYCGQNKKIHKILDDLAKEYEIALLEESFEW